LFYTIFIYTFSKHKGLW